MSDEHHHHLFHHKKEEVTVYPDNSVSEQTTVEYGREGEYETIIKEEKHHKRMEHVGELGTAAAGAFALYEKHETKKDPENAHRHKIEEEIAAAAAVGTGGFVFHEHHEKKEDKKEAEEAHGKKHHHLF
ncbi:hypothetical protein KI387_037885 [Taxus chinensis]|uniref:Uncharacterized protein n=1 Tax=Taxus chinensis TaxID=29808 RepID=A0AA38FVC6_TAXCH|nr:hypothetical protein KI387_037885 [Taxus chinensis]